MNKSAVYLLRDFLPETLALHLSTPSPEEDIKAQQQPNNQILELLGDRSYSKHHKRDGIKIWSGL